MSINVKTENAHDATVQVHIAFENASRSGQFRRRRATRSYNRAGPRNHQPVELSVGRNRAVHRSSSKTLALPRPA